jgi:hypothetical protein
MIIWGLNSCRCMRFFSSPRTNSLALAPNQPSIQRCSFEGNFSSQGMRPTTHLHPVLRLRMSEAMPLLPPYVFMTLTEKTFPFSPLLWWILGCDIQTEVIRLRLQPSGSLGNDSLGTVKNRKFLPIWVTLNFSRTLLHAAHNIPAIFLKINWAQYTTLALCVSSWGL